MLEIRGLSFQHHSSHQPAIRDVSLTIEPGTFLAVVGPSGSGKSTLLRAMNGLIPHFHGGRIAGTVLVNGVNSRTASTADLSQHVGFVSQDPEAQTVFDTVIDEVAFGPENLGFRETEIHERVHQALNALQIEHLQDRDISTLSGGERQRTVLAATLAMGSRILVLDEPLSQLDPWAAPNLLKMLNRLSHESGVGIVVAEHRLDEVLRSCTHVLELDLGQTVNGQQRITDALVSVKQPPSLVRLAQALGWPDVPRSVPEAQALYIQHGPELDGPASHATSTGETVISVRDLTVEARGHRLLRNVEFEINAASVTAIMGPNGSGKTTLLRAIAGLQSPRSGLVEMHGRALQSIPSSKRSGVFGFVPQYPAALFLGQSVREEIEIAAGHGANQSRVPEILEMFDLGHLAEQFSWDISGGERQRLALAIASAQRPTLLLLDEPTRGMDQAARTNLKQLISALRDDGTAIVLSTHDSELAASTADQVILLDSGGVRKVGPATDVIQKEPALYTDIARVLGPQWLTMDEVVAVLPSTLARLRQAVPQDTIGRSERSG